jgi:serine/threonine protein phosphatase PrpC
MSNLFKYKISPAHEHHVRTSGFDAHNPDQRYVVKPHDIVQIAQTQSRQVDPRAQALIRAKGMAGKVLGRALGFGALGFATLQPEKAFAFDAQHILGKEGFHLPSILDLSLPAFDNPVWIVGLLGVSSVLAFLSLIIQTIIARRLKTRNKPMSLLQPVSKDLSFGDDKTIKLLERTGERLVIPEPSFKWSIAGATRIGKKRLENQDAFAVFQTDEWKGGFVVCDGAGGHEGGQEASQKAVEHILEFITPEKGNTILIDPIMRLQKVLSYAREMVGQKQIKGITTAIIGIVERDWLYYATLGDGALSVIWPDGMISQHLTEHHVFDGPSNVITAYIGDNCKTPARIGSVRLEPGCMVLAMSDGASDIFAYEDFAANRETYLKAFLKANSDLPNNLLKQIEEARDPLTNAYLHHDNLTLAMACFEVKDVDHG